MIGCEDHIIQSGTKQLRPPELKVEHRQVKAIVSTLQFMVYGNEQLISYPAGY